METVSISEATSDLLGAGWELLVGALNGASAALSGTINVPVFLTAGLMLLVSGWAFRKTKALSLRLICTVFVVGGLWVALQAVRPIRTSEQLNVLLLILCAGLLTVLLARTVQSSKSKAGKIVLSLLVLAAGIASFVLAMPILDQVTQRLPLDDTVIGDTIEAFAEIVRQMAAALARSAA